MDVTELHDEENLLVQMQDRWENYGSLDAIVEKLRHHDDSIGLWKYLNR